jgi:hypothetical protein
VAALDAKKGLFASLEVGGIAEAECTIDDVGKRAPFDPLRALCLSLAIPCGSLGGPFSRFPDVQNRKTVHRTCGPSMMVSITATTAYEATPPARRYARLRGPAELIPFRFLERAQPRSNLKRDPPRARFYTVSATATMTYRPTQPAQGFDKVRAQAKFFDTIPSSIGAVIILRRRVRSGISGEPLIVVRTVSPH